MRTTGGCGRTNPRRHENQQRWDHVSLYQTIIMVISCCHSVSVYSRMQNRIAISKWMKSTQCKQNIEINNMSHKWTLGDEWRAYHSPLINAHVLIERKQATHNTLCYRQSLCLHFHCGAEVAISLSEGIGQEQRRTGKDTANNGQHIKQTEK